MSARFSGLVIMKSKPGTAHLSHQHLRTHALLRSPAELEKAGLISGARAAELGDVAENFATGVSPAMAELIDPGDNADPIARQFVPDPLELTDDELAEEDPIGDARHSPVSGVIHRYPDRVLLTPVRVCAVYCRFCFRRETVGSNSSAMLPPDELNAALDYIRSHAEIWEVILSGGDPLVLSPRRLKGPDRCARRHRTCAGDTNPHTHPRCLTPTASQANSWRR